MAVGLGPLPTLHPVAGFELGIASAGIKREGRKDVVVMRCAEGSSVAGVFTLNAFCAAPVILARQRVKGVSRYLLTNTGNANAGTGEPGLLAATQSCAALAQLVGVDEQAILPFSTGVIGEPLPVEKIIAALPAALADLSEQHWAEAAIGIMTTDTLPKGASRQFVQDGVTITVTGISKGAGMIRPNMATMLGYIATDAKVAPAVLQDLLSDAANKSFNRITIDGDTSTNDCCMLIATGQANLPEVTEAQGPLFAALKQAVFEVCMDVAQAIVRDGEGATKFVTVVVNGGGTHQECLDVGYTVAHSPLIKTALFASDPNWGRILAAVGRAGVDQLDVSKIDVFLGDVCIASRGARSGSYTEEQGAAVMAEAESASASNWVAALAARPSGPPTCPTICADQRRIPFLSLARTVALSLTIPVTHGPISNGNCYWAGWLLRFSDIVSHLLRLEHVHVPDPDYRQQKLFFLVPARRVSHGVSPGFL